MGEFQLLDQVVSDRVKASVREAAELMHSSVRPIFGSEDGNDATPIGSCILVNVGGHKLVVTAAHVIDKIDATSLHVLGRVGSRPIQIKGSIRHTKAARRSDDKYDFAYWSIPDDDITRLGAVTFLNKEQISYNQASFDQRLYVAMGYPLRRNTKISKSKKTLRAVMRTHAGAVVKDSELCERLSISGDHHLFLRYEKFSVDRDGKRVNSFSPRGMSGGALVDLGSFSSPERIAGMLRCPTLLAGMIVEKPTNSRVLVSTRFDYIFKAISDDVAAL